MSGPESVLVLVAVLALVLVRQVKPQQISAGARIWVLPAVLAYCALRQPGLLDPARPVASGWLLAAEFAVGLGTGALWAWSMRVWAGDDGTAWVRGSISTAAVWIAGIAVRGGLVALGAVLGIRLGGSGGGALLLGFAVTLLVRSGLLAWRAGLLAPAYGGPVGGRKAAAGKDC
ncbi:DUF1453 domain-containing protein [Streptomyces sp. ODS28]|uniref:DUF1453 domain-containing protein n=1 Tax=Streptomyces sp. ODS28 TaxID=3136688 RepID=UPI0031EC36E3